MTKSHIGSTKTQRNILEFLKSLRLLPDYLVVEVISTGRTGVLHVSQGQVIAAECGSLQGNGALLSLVTIGEGDVHVVKSEKSVASNVSITVTQIERLLAKLPGLSAGGSHCDEERLFQDAIRLFFQFRRKEAGVKLVEVLRSNRFYYPAWLLHSRLMTREDYIKKALNEARKWGNVDPSIKREANKIALQFTGSPETVKRCIFCWSLVRPGKERCDNCHGLQRISGMVKPGGIATEELQQTVSLYEEAMHKDPENSRIAYCLCLGFCSLGKTDRGREFINKALKISPREPLFVKTSALLQPVQNLVRQESLQKLAVRQVGAHKVVPAVHAISVGDKRAKTDKTVLVVDDSKTARKVVSLVLGRKGYNIIEATSGTEARLAIEGVTPDLVHLDVMMPDMTGYEVLSTIRKNSEFSDVPVVMLTGKRGAADRQKGMISGSNEYLTKPFNPAKLLSVLGKYLEPSETKIKTQQPKYATKVESPVPHPQLKPAPELRPTVAKSSVAEPQGKGLDRSILVVEDSPTSRKVINMVLSRNGYVVNEAATGREALRKVQEEVPQLILLDAMLPDISGYDILAQLKQDQQLKGIPVVMLTAKNSPVDREKGMRAGSAAYLTKPFNPDKLLSVIGGYFKPR
jgi:twitching motility two-component system response regulator PilG